MRLNYFNFKRFGSKIILTNDFGYYVFVTPSEFSQILHKCVDEDSPLGKELSEKRFVYYNTSLEFSAFAKYGMREAKRHLAGGTSLHIFVVTTACNAGCVYCQANNGITVPTLYMDEKMAEKAVDIALQSPELELSFEFQGGEPLLNFEIIKHIVEYAEEKKNWHDVKYSIVTNLTLLTDEIIDFLEENKVSVSTSIDGPYFIHNLNRPLKDGTGSFVKVLNSIERLRDRNICVGAIQTTTKASLNFPKEIVRAYKEIGFDSIFIRPLTPLGKASKDWDDIGYTPEEFLTFYTLAVDELLVINKEGYFLRENQAAILLEKMNGQSLNYMELRSPCGAGVGQIAYYADGNIFTCDEGRMLYEMGDDTFQLGNVFSSTYSDLIKNSNCKTVCAASILEALPGCCDCIYQPFCGTCPVVNYAKMHDIIDKTPRGYKCKIYSGILDYLFGLRLDNDEKVQMVLNSWSN